MARGGSKQHPCRCVAPRTCTASSVSTVSATHSSPTTRTTPPARHYRVADEAIPVPEHQQCPDTDTHVEPVGACTTNPGGARCEVKGGSFAVDSAKIAAARAAAAAGGGRGAASGWVGGWAWAGGYCGGARGHVALRRLSLSFCRSLPAFTRRPTAMRLPFAHEQPSRRSVSAGWHRRRRER